mmetsp:Transcript_65009/g.121078  ORF Transcript_65009/g.121078 Transcript_65009/m.121078 type:complete len:101 (+) Transcript_65009:89-391(+)
MLQHWAKTFAARTSQLSLVCICICAYVAMVVSASRPAWGLKALLGDSVGAVASPQAVNEDCGGSLMDPVARLAIVSSLSLAAGGALTIPHPLTHVMLGIL